jgi:WD40 repeat protein
MPSSATEARQELVTFRGHDDGARGVAFSPDGRRLASVADDGIVRLWDLKLGIGGVANPLIQTLSGGKGLYPNVAFSKDGRLLASGGGHRGGWLKLWDATTGKEIALMPGAGPPVAFSPDDRHVAAVGAHFAIEIRDIRDAPIGRTIRTLPGHSWAIPALAFHPDPALARLASASADGTMRIWDVTGAREIIRRRHGAHVMGVAFSGDGRYVASGSSNRSVKVWDAETGELQETLPDPTGAAQCVAFHPNNDRVLVWGSSDATVKVGNWRSQQIHTLRGHTRWVESVAFSPDGEWIASASLDRTVKLWKTPSLP